MSKSEHTATSKHRENCDKCTDPYDLYLLQRSGKMNGGPQVPITCMGCEERGRHKDGCRWTFLMPSSVEYSVVGEADIRIESAWIGGQQLSNQSNEGVTWVFKNESLATFHQGRSMIEEDDPYIPGSKRHTWAMDDEDDESESIVCFVGAPRDQVPDDRHVTVRDKVKRSGDSAGTDGSPSVSIQYGSISAGHSGTGATGRVSTDGFRPGGASADHCTSTPWPSRDRSRRSFGRTDDGDEADRMEALFAKLGEKLGDSMAQK